VPDHIPLLILIGRPGAGKSEIIDYLKKTPRDTRRARFHIGPFVEIDDFPMLWAWFEEDQILAELGYDRLHSDAEGYFTHHGLWNVLIHRLELEHRKLLAEERDFPAEKSAIVEFSRGSEHGGFAEAFTHFADDFLCHAADG
jgi:hypothetical protein